MADDMGFSDLGCYGGEIATPNLDAFGRNGVRFSQFYNTARCSPSRASLLTGLHPHQTGIGVLVNNDGPGGYPGSLDTRCATLAEMLGAAGYATSMSGKWHLSADRSPNPTWPTRRGFQQFWGTISGAGSYFQPSTLHDGETAVDVDDLGEDFYYTDAIGGHAADAIRADAASGRPFFSYVAFTAPHWPLHARREDIAAYNGVYEAGWDVLRAARHQRMVTEGLVDADAPTSTRDALIPAWPDEPEHTWQASRMRAYAAQVSALDRAVGVIRQALEETGQRENTIVVFLSDNGGSAEDVGDGASFRHQRHIVPAGAPDGSPLRIGNTPDITPGPADTYTSYGRAWANLSNAPFRLYKRWVHEGGIATPLIVDWPAGHLAAGSVVHEPHQLTDIVPTLLEAAGVPVPSHTTEGGQPALPGVSMLAALRGAEATPHQLFWEHIGNAATCRGRWKLVREYLGAWELYDLDAGRAEEADLADEHPDLVTEMARAWQEWADMVGVIPREQVVAVQEHLAARGVPVIGGD